MTINFLFLVGVFLFTSFFVMGQTIPPIQTDRPDQTECPYIVPEKFIQIENGFINEKMNSEVQSYVYPSTLWKYGINDRIEMRLITEIVSIMENKNSTTGITPITIGFKTNVSKENGIIPLTSFIGHITTSNIGHPAFRTSYIAPSFRFTMQHTLTSKVSLGYNIGTEWNGETAQQTFIYTLTTGFMFTEKFGGYFELYGSAQNHIYSNNNFDSGLTYLITNHMMVDLSAGINLVNYDSSNFLSLGYSYRFSVIKNKKY